LTTPCGRRVYDDGLREGVDEFDVAGLVSPKMEVEVVLSFERPVLCCYVNTLRVQREPGVPPIPRRKTWTTPGDQFGRGTPRKAAQPPNTGPTSFITGIPVPNAGLTRDSGGIWRRSGVYSAVEADEAHG